MHIAIRVPAEEDVQSISECIRSSSELSQMTDGSREGIDDWNDLCSPEELLGRIRSRELSLVACITDLVAGYIAFKRSNHLSLLFVRNGYQRKGIGRALLAASLPKFSKVTVNSSDLAVPFYERIGFQVVGDRFLKRGAWSTPMQWANPAMEANGE